MKVYMCTDFKGVWPVGSAAVVVAATKAKAKIRLLETLKNWKHLDEKNLDLDFTMEEVDTTKTSATILNDGDY